ncbi:BglG family transcription antiterminator [Clostridium thermobutyricum]|uniref:Transcriptional regulator ManR n=1 Tax=Clostridium thermobutyricum DSM 4928 TaxID=1121339 RepID=A0A1V4SX15_9CLOT|nr:BglG family transcription antiterminator [Clostridium thermobutyricum]OPX48197.1 transcriptional regulator ManR [Clostridium thermobutyricum DSM 4928]
MITLSKRQSDILKFLGSKDEYITINKISEQFKCSPRTIRNDLDVLKKFLRDSNGNIEKKPRLGIKLILKKGLFLEELIKKSEVDIYSYNNRVDMIILILILKGKLTIEKLSNEIGVSKNTLVNDLKDVEKKLKNYKVDLSKKVYYGISLESEEENIRNTFIKIYLGLEENLKIEIKERLKIESNLSNLNIQYKIVELEKLLGTKYSEESIEEFEIAILLSSCRVKNGFKIIKNSNENRREFDVLKEFLNLDISEIGYLVTISDGLRKTKGGKEDKVTEEILKEMCNVLNIDFSKDLEFKSQIGIHLKSAIHRIKNNLTTENQMLEEIKYKMSFIFEITKQILDSKEKLLGVKFPESEIAYMAMYFDAIFERNVKSNFTYNILVVCNGGLATSSLLKTRLNAMIPEANILGICRVSDVEKKLKNEEVDFIVTTVPLAIKNYKTIKVNPLLEYSDAEKIKVEIYNKRYEKNCKYLLDKVKKTESEGITKLIKEEYAIFDKDIESWEDAIKEAANPLIKTNMIKEEYVIDIINVIEELGNYMVFIPEIAFVHAPPENVNENSMSILTLKEKIEFGFKNKVQVKAIVLIANKNENMNLVNLINIITKNDNIEKFKNLKSYEELRKIT